MLELRAIDSDLFGVGWGQRIGSRLYEGLLTCSDSPGESAEPNGLGSPESKPTSASRKKKKGLPEEAVGAENGVVDERRKEGEW